MYNERMVKRVNKWIDGQSSPSLGVIYARYSSNNQRDESIEQQVAECRKFAASQGITVIEIYSDAAQTGRNDRRTSYQRLLRDAKKGTFEYILAYKSSRIARNMFNALKFENEMERYNIKVLYAKEEFGNNAAGRFALRTMMNVNQFFSENMGEDVKRALDDNARQGLANSIPPYGYRIGEDRRFAIDEETAPIAKEIFQRVAAGEQYISIARDLNARGLRTRLGKEWNKSSFYGIVTNERYTGVYLFGNVRIEGGMPALVSKELFSEAQKAMKEKKRVRGRHNPNGDYLLTGKVFCGECREHMVGVSGTSHDGTTHYYYACSNQWNKQGCKKKAVRRDALEYKVTVTIKQFIVVDENIQWIADEVMSYQRRRDEDSERLLLEDDLKTTELSIGNIMKAIEAGIFTETTKSRLLELEEKKAELNRRIAVVKSQEIAVTREQIIEWLYSFKDGDPYSQEYRRKLFNTFLRSVYVYDDKLRIVFDIDDREEKTVDISFLDETTDGGEVRIDSDRAREMGAIRTRDGVSIVRIKTSFVLTCRFLK